MNKFYVVSSESYHRLRRAVEETAANAKVLSTRSESYGWGPDCCYEYQWLVVTCDPISDPGDTLVDVAFGAAAGRRVECKEVTADEAKRFVTGARRASIPVPRPVVGLDCYKCYGGGYAAWVNPALIDYLMARR
jgi:hypothetical protein